MRISRATVLDTLLAAGFAGLGGWEALAKPDIPGPPPYTAVTAALGALALVWRRRYPRAVLVAVAAVGVAPHLVTGAEPAFYGFLLPFLVAAYTASARLPQRRSLLVPVVGLAVFAALAARGREFRSLNQVLIIALALGAAYGVGRVVRLFRDRAEHAVAVAELLRREQDLRAREAVAAEHERLARELHDAITHEVSVMVIQAGAAERMLDHDGEQARASLRAVQEAGRRTVGELSLMLGLLHGDEAPPTAPGLGGIPELVARVAAAGLAVRLRESGSAPQLPGPVGLCAYRVVQEALTNVLKHTRGARVSVSVDYGGGSVAVRVCDDGGTGVRPAQSSGGRGLAGLAERVRAFGGQFQAGTDGSGFAVAASLPLVREPA